MNMKKSCLMHMSQHALNGSERNCVRSCVLVVRKLLYEKGLRISCKQNNLILEGIQTKQSLLAFLSF